MAIEQATDFGRLIRDYRHRADMTQEELGRRINFDNTSISQFETGQRQPPKNLEFYSSIASALDIDAAESEQLAFVGNPLSWTVFQNRVAVGLKEVHAPELQDLFTPASPLTLAVLRFSDPSLSDDNRKLLAGDINICVNFALGAWKQHLGKTSTTR